MGTIRTLAELDTAVCRCRSCPRLVAWREEVARTRRAAFRDQEYWGRPVPGLRTGRRAHRDPRPRPGRARRQPDRSGLHRRPLRRRAVRRAVPGRAGQPADQRRPRRRPGADRHPDLRGRPVRAAGQQADSGRTRPSAHRWLRREVELLRPTVRVVVALGAFAWAAVLADPGRRLRGGRAESAADLRSRRTGGGARRADRCWVVTTSASRTPLPAGSPRQCWTTCSAPRGSAAGLAGLTGAGGCVSTGALVAARGGGRPARRGHARRRLRQPADRRPATASAAARDRRADPVGRVTAALRCRSDGSAAQPAPDRGPARPDVGVGRSVRGRRARDGRGAHLVAGAGTGSASGRSRCWSRSPRQRTRRPSSRSGRRWTPAWPSWTTRMPTRAGRSSPAGCGWRRPPPRPGPRGRPATRRPTWCPGCSPATTSAGRCWPRWPRSTGRPGSPGTRSTRPPGSRPGTALRQLRDELSAGARRGH